MDLKLKEQSCGRARLCCGGFGPVKSAELLDATRPSLELGQKCKFCARFELTDPICRPQAGPSQTSSASSGSSSGRAKGREFNLSDYFKCATGRWMGSRGEPVGEEANSNNQWRHEGRGGVLGGRLPVWGEMEISRWMQPPPPPRGTDRCEFEVWALGEGPNLELPPSCSRRTTSGEGIEGCASKFDVRGRPLRVIL